MQKLNEKIKELELQGLSKEEIQSQTQDLFESIVNEPLTTPARYLVDLTVTVAIDSKIKLERLEALLSEPDVERLILNLDNQEVATEVLRAELESIKNWEEL